MRVMFVTGRLNDETSGVTRVMCDLANALGRRGTMVTVYAAEQKGGPIPGSNLLQSPARFVSRPGKWLGGLSYSPKLRQTIDEELVSTDVVHSHSLWMLPNHYAAAAGHKQGKPVVFTAHGALEPWAVSRSNWKKRLVAGWWQDRDLRRSSCIHVFTRAEIAGIRAYGLKNPVAVIPNGVDLGPFDELPARSVFSSSIPAMAGKKILLFLSRLHVKKGLAHLVEAWKALHADHPDWHLVIAGPDDGAGTEMRGRIASLGLADSVTMAGPLQGAAKLAAFAAADAFILPSFSEGFSMAVLEAMACRLPVVITPGCNFNRAVEAGAAIEVPADAAGTERGLRQLMEMPDDDRRGMGQRGRELVESNYTWDAVASDLMTTYAWLLGGGSPPPFIEFN